MKLQAVHFEGKALKPSDRLKSLAKDDGTIFKVDANGLAEVWLGSRIWLVGPHDEHKPHDSLDPYKPYARTDGGTGPVVNVMTDAEAAYVRAFVAQAAA